MSSALRWQPHLLGADQVDAGRGDPRRSTRGTLIAVAVSSVGAWAFHALILREIKEAAWLNRVVTVAKVIPLLVFVGIVAFAFNAGVFREKLWGGVDRSAGVVFEQVKATMLITVFVFVGVEGAIVYSRYARRREVVGKAAVLGFLGMLTLLVAVSLLSYGILPKAELSELR